MASTGWASGTVYYLTALRQPSFRVEGSSFKPPHFHFYGPHAALQHKAQHHCLFSLLWNRCFIHYLRWILQTRVVNVPWVVLPRPPEWLTWHPHRWLTRSGRPASVCRQRPPNLLWRYQTRTLLCHSWWERSADEDVTVRQPIYHRWCSRISSVQYSSHSPEFCFRACFGWYTIDPAL